MRDFRAHAILEQDDALGAGVDEKRDRMILYLELEDHTGLGWRRVFDFGDGHRKGKSFFVVIDYKSGLREQVGTDDGVDAGGQGGVSGEVADQQRDAVEMKRPRR